MSREVATIPSADAEQEKAVPKKQRTKTGCLVCRRRRIKCGEEKPVCRNCAKTKRICEQAPPLVPRGSHARQSRRDPHHREPSLGENEAAMQSGTMPMSPSAIDIGPGLSYGDAVLPPNKAYATIMQPPLRSHISSDSAQSTWEDAYNFPGDLMHASELGLQPPTIEVAIDPFNQAEYPTQCVEQKLSPRIEIHRLDSNYSDLSLGGQNYQGVHLSEPVTMTRQQRQYNDTSMTKNSESPPLASAGHQSRPVTLGSPSESTSTLVAVPGSSRGGFPLKSKQSHYLKHFIDNVNMNFTSVIEIKDPNSSHIHIQPSNFWSFVIPSMAVKSVSLLHAVLAISALHEANISNNSEHQALLDYHQSIRKLARALQEPGAQDRQDLLATCLILAYFETMGGETVKWGRHLQGACDLVRNRIVKRYSSNKERQPNYTSAPSIDEHLIWFHIHQDTIQALLSGNGLFLDLQYIEMVPMRNDPGTITHASDQLRVFLAKVGDFACKDRQRKEDAYSGLQELNDALQHWSMLLNALKAWNDSLGSRFAGKSLDEYPTPCGTAITFNHPAIASLQMMYSGAILYMHRCHPELSAVPAEAIRTSAGTTYEIGRGIFRMMTGVMLESANNKKIDQGCHIKAMINGVLPVFLAGIALRDDDERDHVEGTLRDVYRLSGWRTVSRVLQGLDVAWQRIGNRNQSVTSLTPDQSDLQTNGVLELRYTLRSGPDDTRQDDGTGPMGFVDDAIDPRSQQHPPHLYQDHPQSFNANQSQWTPDEVYLDPQAYCYNNNAGDIYDSFPRQTESQSMDPMLQTMDSLSHPSHQPMYPHHHHLYPTHQEWPQ